MKIILITLLMCFAHSTTNAQNAYIQVNGEAGLSVFLNGQFKGKTTAELNGYIIENVTPGSNRIKIVKEGYTPFEENISVRSGEVLSYKVKPFAKHVVTISEKGNNDETDKKASIATGKLIIQSVPIEIKITIPDIEGISDKLKTKDEWIADKIPAGQYKIIFSFNNKIIEKDVEITGDETVRVFANMLNGEIKVKNSQSVKQEIESYARVVDQLALKYKFKTGLTPKEFASYNVDAARLFRLKGNKFNNTISYSNTSSKGNPYPEGPYALWVDRDLNEVIYYNIILESGNNTLAHNLHFEQYISDIREQIGDAFIKNTQYGIEIDVPGASVNLSITKVKFGEWTEWGLFFSKKK